MSQKNPQMKKTINTIENAYKEGNVSAQEAVRQLTNRAKVSKALSERFVRQWTHEIKHKNGE